jgi:hypothetical protein
MLLPPLFIGGLAVLQIIAARLGARAEIRNMRATNLALGCLALGIAVPAWTALREPSQSSMFIRNGAVDYREFREHIRQMPSTRTLLAYYGRGGGLSPKRSIPLYLNEWHGLARVWGGEHVALDGTLADSYINRHDSLLIVLDKPASLTQYPADMKKFMDYVEGHGQKTFSSSNDRIQIFNLNMQAMRQFMSATSQASFL